MPAIMRQGSTGNNINRPAPAIMRQGAVEQFRKIKPVEEMVKDEYSVFEDPSMVTLAEDKEEITLIDYLRGEFEKQEGKEVPRNKKNDVEWIKSKLNT